MKVNTTYATLLSVAYVAAAFFCANQLGDGLKSLKPNEFGDLLAGIFSPVAFAWFVIAVFMQREELSLQRRELAMQREELKGSREALQKTSKHAQLQAEALQAQAEINQTSIKLASFESGLKRICTSINSILDGADGGGGSSDNIIYWNGFFIAARNYDLIDREDYLTFLQRVISAVENINNSKTGYKELHIHRVSKQEFLDLLDRIQSFTSAAPEFVSPAVSLLKQLESALQTTNVEAQFTKA